MNVCMFKVQSLHQMMLGEYFVYLCDLSEEP